MDYVLHCMTRDGKYYDEDNLSRQELDSIIATRDLSEDKRYTVRSWVDDNGVKGEEWETTHVYAYEIRYSVGIFVS